MLHLHTFAQSSASYRVRIVLALKGLDWRAHGVSLLANDHHSADFLKINPQGRVPALITDHGMLNQSFSIIDWLEDAHPQSASIYPRDLWQKALCRAFAHTIATDIFPLQNLNVRRKLQAEFEADEVRQARWCADWIAKGFAALEQETASRGWTPEAGYLFGENPTLADVCLVPQMNNARRFKVDLNAFPLLFAADANARAHPAFASTAPETQAG